jgi:hypothetical protein
MMTQAILHMVFEWAFALGVAGFVLSLVFGWAVGMLDEVELTRRSGDSL